MKPDILQMWDTDYIPILMESCVFGITFIISEYYYAKESVCWALIADENKWKSVVNELKYSQTSKPNFE